MNEGAMGNQSTLKALRIIEYLSARHNEPARLSDIARALEMNICTATRFLASLRQEGYVAQNASTQKYTLTAKLCSLANSVRDSLDIPSLAGPYLKELCTHFDESTCLAVEKEMEVVYTATVRNPSSVLRSTQRIGNRAPMHCTGVGKLLLLDKDSSYIDGLIAVKKLTPFTDKTITTRERLLRELSLIRQRGYSIDDGECELGVKCIAVPIYDSTNRIIAAMSVTGPENRISRLTERDIAYIRDSATALSEELGASPQA